jgi:hypothetical protein
MPALQLAVSRRIKSNQLDLAAPHLAGLRNLTLSSADGQPMDLTPHSSSALRAATQLTSLTLDSVVIDLGTSMPQLQEIYLHRQGRGDSNIVADGAMECLQLRKWHDSSETNYYDHYFQMAALAGLPLLEELHVADAVELPELPGLVFASLTSLKVGPRAACAHDPSDSTDSVGTC